MRVVICGGGVIGTSIAYFLSRRAVEVVVVERTGVACGASGKSGGFIALDWCDGSPLGPLARRSFVLHAELAEAHGNPWGYRRLDTLSVVASARRRLGDRGGREPPAWLAAEALVQQRLGHPATTAQIHPARFTEGMMAAATARGARLHMGTVTDLVRAPDGDRIVGAVVDGEEIRGDAVVIAMGPWSVLAARWLPLPTVYGIKGNSLVFRTAQPIPAEALFVECEAADGTVDHPEVVPRPDGTTYLSGMSGEAPLPVDPADVAPDPTAEARLRAMAMTFAPALGKAEVVAVQACYRPIVQDGLPLIGRVPGIAGAYVATGHSVWGMLNAPATGEAMAELIVEGAVRAVDLAPFEPGRLPPLDRDPGRAGAPLRPGAGSA
ncbi:MAG TPA: FAD-dependent oxidoreductase [Geminicoccaceae bacterium]